MYVAVKLWYRLLYPSLLISVINILIRNVGEAGHFWVPDQRDTYTFETAKKICYQLLPDGERGRDDLLKVMGFHGIRSAWLEWYLHSSNWTWLDQSQLNQSLSVEGNEKSIFYAVLHTSGKLMAQNHHLDETMDPIPVLCELRGKGCEQTYSVFDCMEYDGSAFVGGVRQYGWYIANSFCRHLGGRLAILDTLYKLEIVSAFLRNHPKLSKYHHYWIGLVKEQWRGTTGAEISTNQWDHREPTPGNKCVVIVRKNRAALWKTATCSEKHPAVCVAGQFSPINTLPDKPNTKSEAMQKFTYWKGNEMGNYTDALRLCPARENWYFATDLQNWNSLSKYMVSKNINTAWLPWTLRSWNKWRWINKVELKEKIQENENGNCGSFDHLLKTYYISPCHRQGFGYMCEYMGQLQCWETFHSYNCMKTESSTFIVGLEIESWFQAFSVCQHLNGRLAVVNESLSTSRIAEYMDRNKYLYSKDFLYVGLVKENWELPTSLAAGNSSGPSLHNMWVYQEPKPGEHCSIMQLQNGRLFWRSSQCEAYHTSLCTSENPLPGHQTHTATTNTMQESTTVSESFKKIVYNDVTDDSKRGLLISAGIVIFLLAGFILFYKCVIKRNGCGFCENETEETGVETNNHNIEEGSPLIATVRYQVNGEGILKYREYSDKEKEILVHGQEKLAKYFIESFCLLNLYSASGGEEGVDFLKLYIPMTWRRYCRFVLQPMPLEGFHELLNEITNNGGKKSRLVVDGDAGSGKSTFIKSLCFCWAQLQLHRNTTSLHFENEQSRMKDVVSEYIFIFPVILRAVSDQSTLLDIIKSQIDVFTNEELEAIGKVMEHTPEKILILADGYDEMVCHSNYIERLINNKTCRTIKCITTSRPYAVNQLRKTKSCSLQCHVRLCGFNKEQVFNYIDQYFSNCENPPKHDNVQELKLCLSSEKPTLMELAKTPIRTEMICTVWEKHQQLGNTLGHLYYLFVMHLLHHSEAKEKETEEMLDVHQLQTKYSGVLYKIGQLSYSWQRKGENTITDKFRKDRSYITLPNTFTDEILKKTLGDSLTSAIKIGCLTKQHPDNRLFCPTWEFTHLTLQEYFVAYYLSNAEDKDNAAHFESMCQYPVFLKHHVMILNFLFYLSPARFNAIMTRNIQNISTKYECKTLMDLLLNQLPDIENKADDLAVPLPPYVDMLATREDTKTTILQNLIKTDKLQQHQNLKTLIIDGRDSILRQHTLCTFDYLHNLTLCFRGAKLSDSSFSFQSLLRSFFVQELFGMYDDQKSMYKNDVPKTKSCSSRETGSNIDCYLKECQIHLERLTSCCPSHKTVVPSSLQNQEVVAISFPFYCENLSFELSSNHLCAFLYAMKNSIIKKEVKYLTVRNCNESVAIDALEIIKTGQISIYNLSFLKGTFLEGSGQFAKIFLYTYGVSFHSCTFSNNTMQSLAYNLEYYNLENSVTPVKEFSITCEQYDDLKLEIGAIQSVISNLHNLTSLDLHNITTDNIADLEELPQLQSLRLGSHIGLTNWSPLSIGSALECVFDSLLVLAIPGCNIEDQFEDFVKNLVSSMKMLQVLELFNIVCKEGECVHFLRYMPQSLKHLTLSAMERVLEPPVVENKYPSLLSFNIHINEDALIELQENFQKLGLKTKVYWNDMEDVWKEFVTERNPI